MTELTSDLDIQNQRTEDLSRAGEELVREQVSVQNKAAGVFTNFTRLIYDRSRQLYLTIFGDYFYKPKNQFSYRQQKKIINYLQAMVLSTTAEWKDKEKVKFTDYDPEYLSVPPTNFEELRFKILKGRTNIQAAEDSLLILQNSKKQLMVKYVNEQAYEFDRVKNNSLAWGLLIGAAVNATIYRRGNTIRKTALFLTFGHIFAICTYRNNLNRYFDSVYPIFREEAVKYTSVEKELFKDWQPEGKFTIDG